MTNEEALKIVNECIEEGKIVQEAFDYSFMYTVQEALEKQIPKKPDNVKDKYWACPCCGTMLMVRWITYPVNPVPLEAGRNFCEECGQAIDWSEVEE